VRTDVPITSTSREIAILPPKSLLSYQSIQQLLRTYQEIMEVRDDATARAEPEEGDPTDSTNESLALPDRQTTTAICTDDRDDMSTTCQSVDATTGGE
jgi:hypothetical protein